MLIGKATRISQYLISLDKEYEGTIELGKVTDSQDAQGQVMETRPVPPLTEAELRTAMQGFLGDQYQMPPMYSAIKIDGVPLYKSARKGEEVEREPRFIRVSSFELTRFGLPAFAAALAATIAWAWLVRWRTRRHRRVIWKSVVLPAGGAALCWLLLMTLWLPVLDYARSYRTVVAGVVQHVGRPGCVAAFGLSRAQIAALRFHGDLEVRLAGRDAACPWLLVALQAAAAAPVALDMRGWELAARVRRPVDATEDLLLYRKARAR